jgi:hypothetical protein
MAVLFYLSEKYLFSSVPYQKLCVFAALREIFDPVPVNRRMVSGRL